MHAITVTLLSVWLRFASAEKLTKVLSLDPALMVILWFLQALC